MCRQSEDNTGYFIQCVGYSEIANRPFGCHLSEIYPEEASSCIISSFCSSHIIPILRAGDLCRITGCHHRNQGDNTVAGAHWQPDLACFFLHGGKREPGGVLLFLAPSPDIRVTRTGRTNLKGAPACQIPWLLRLSHETGIASVMGGDDWGTAETCPLLWR